MASSYSFPTLTCRASDKIERREPLSILKRKLQRRCRWSLHPTCLQM